MLRHSEFSARDFFLSRFEPNDSRIAFLQHSKTTPYKRIKQFLIKIFFPKFDEAFEGELLSRGYF